MRVLGQKTRVGGGAKRPPPAFIGLTYYMKGDMKTRTFYKNIRLYITKSWNNKDKIISKFCRVAFPKDFKK